MPRKSLKPPKPIDPAKLLRKHLNQIQEMLLSDVGPQLWDVLSALRGPDVKHYDYKHATTEILRSAAFPSLPYRRIDLPATFAYADKAPLATTRVELAQDNQHYHFREHALKAFDALGLKWSEVNDLSKGRE